MPSKDARETEHPAQSGGELELEFTLRLSGELAGARVAEFERALRAALQASPREIIVDLTGVEHIDPTGLTALMKAHLRVRQRGLTLRFVPADHEAVKQVVAFTGTDEPSD